MQKTEKTEKPDFISGLLLDPRERNNGKTGTSKDIYYPG